MPSAGGNYYGEFITSNPTTGAIQTADTLPVATANHNGTDDGSFALTVTLLATGRYLVSGTIPSGYQVDDWVKISAAATVSSVAGGGIIDRFTISPPETQAINGFEFFMALSTDGRSAAIGKTVTGTRSTDGGAPLPLDNSGSITEVGNGLYKIDLTLNDLTYTSTMNLIFQAPGCDSTIFALI